MKRKRTNNCCYSQINHWLCALTWNVKQFVRQFHNGTKCIASKSVWGEHVETFTVLNRNRIWIVHDNSAGNLLQLPLFLSIFLGAWPQGQPHTHIYLHHTQNRTVHGAVTLDPWTGSTIAEMLRISYHTVMNHRSYLDLIIADYTTENINKNMFLPLKTAHKPFIESPYHIAFSFPAFLVLKTYWLPVTEEARLNLTCR